MSMSGQNMHESDGPTVEWSAPRGSGVNGKVVAVVPAKDEIASIADTLRALIGLEHVGAVVVVDDGSVDATADAARKVEGVEVIVHDRNQGKAAAMMTGAARAAELAPQAPVLFADADLGSSAGSLGVLLPPVLTGAMDMTIAILPPQEGAGGLGVVVKTAREGIKRLAGWSPEQPLSGQRCVSRASLDAAMPLAPGWGVEVGLTVDVLRAGGRVMEIPCPLTHRPTGNDLAGQMHRAKQLADVTRALADRAGAAATAREKASELGEQARSGAQRLAEQARVHGTPLVAKAKEKGMPWLREAKDRAARAWGELQRPADEHPAASGTSGEEPSPTVDPSGGQPGQEPERPWD